jgi:hypothetical protein
MPSVKRIFRETTLLERRYRRIQGFDSTFVPNHIARIGDGNHVKIFYNCPMNGNRKL